MAPARTKPGDLIVAGECALNSPAGLFAGTHPQEHIWDEVREKAFPNLVLDQMALVVERLRGGLSRLAADADRIRRIAAWPWIVSLNLKVN